MHHLEIDTFSGIRSPIQRWDPRLKIPVLLVLAFGISVLRDIRFAAVGLVVASALVLISRLPKSFVLHRLEWVLLFLVPFAVIMPITVTGRPLLQLGRITVSYEGVRLASLISLKAIAIVLLILPMFGTAPFHISVKAIQQLKAPGAFVQIILFTYRYIFIFAEEVGRMNDAAKTRGFVAKTRWHTFKTLGNFIGILLIRSFERTEYLHNAMISRGYTGKLKALKTFRITTNDIAKAAAILAACLMLVLGDRVL